MQPPNTLFALSSFQSILSLGGSCKLHVEAVGLLSFAPISSSLGAGMFPAVVQLQLPHSLSATLFITVLL